MRSLTFDEVFAMLSAVQLSASDLARLREWIAGLAHPAECIALIEHAARGRPCPRCGCGRVHRCGQASGLQRFRCRASGHHARGGERVGRHSGARRDPHPERQQLAQPLQELAGAVPRRREPLPHQLFWLATAAGCAPPDDTRAPAVRCGPARLRRLRPFT